MHLFVALMRRYVVDYLLCQNPAVCAQIMEPHYVLHMAGTELGPRATRSMCLPSSGSSSSSPASA